MLFGNNTPAFSGSSQWLWNFGDGFFSPQNDTQRISHQYNKTGQFDVYLSEFDSVPNSGKYCAAIYPDTSLKQPKITITVLPYDSVKLIPTPQVVCVGETIQFKAILQSQNQYKQYYWNYDNQADSNNLLTYSKVIKSIGQHTLTWQADTNGLGHKSCPAYASIDVYADSVIADFSIDKSNEPEYCFNNLSKYAVSYRWGYYHEKDIVPGKDAFIPNANQREPDRYICENFGERGGDQWGLFGSHQCIRL